MSGEQTHHYVLTIQWREGAAVHTHTEEGTYTQNGATRQQAYRHLVAHVRENSGSPADAHVLTLFFSLELNELGTTELT